MSSLDVEASPPGGRKLALPLAAPEGKEVGGLVADAGSDGGASEATRDVFSKSLPLTKPPTSPAANEVVMALAAEGQRLQRKARVEIAAPQDPEAVKMLTPPF